MKNLIFTFIVCLMSFVVASCNSGNNTSDKNMTEESIKGKPIEERIKDVASIEDARQLLNGTTWHYTENLDNSDIGCWLKVEFQNGSYTTYYALPSDGKWTKDKTGTYELKEGRYNNTGKRYISVNWNGNIKIPRLGIEILCEMAMTTDNFQLHVHSSQIDAVLYDGRGMMKRIIMKGTMEYGDYSWD